MKVVFLTYKKHLTHTLHTHTLIHLHVFALSSLIKAQCHPEERFVFLLPLIFKAFELQPSTSRTPRVITHTCLGRSSSTLWSSSSLYKPARGRTPFHPRHRNESFARAWSDLKSCWNSSLEISVMRFQLAALFCCLCQSCSAINRRLSIV